MDKKPAWRSKTMVINGTIAATAWVDTVLAYAEPASAMLPNAAPYIAVLATFNMLLRAVTKLPVFVR